MNAVGRAAVALLAAALAAAPAAASAGASPRSCTSYAGGYVNRGTITLAGGAVLCDSGTFTNAGTITVAAGGSATIEVAKLLNEGTISAPAGTTLTLADRPANLEGTTLTGGAWSVAGTLLLPGTVDTLAAAVTLDGGGAVEDSAAAGDPNAFDTLADIASSATFHLDDSAGLDTGGVTSSGTVILGTAGVDSDAVNWQAAGAFHMTGGSFTFLDPNSCINVGPRAFTITGGTMSGFGMLTGTVTVSGSAVFAPTLGGGTAAFWLNGSYTQTGGTFVDDVLDPSGSASAGSFSASGPVSLGGTLVVDSSGERPPASTALQIVSSSASLTGGFSAVRSDGVAGFSTAVSGGDALSLVATATAPPAAPRRVAASLASNGAAAVHWSAPASDGGKPLTGYLVQPSPACACSGLDVAGAGSLSTVVRGLTDGTAYTFTVRATNAVGTGVASAPSGSVRPLASQGFWLASADGQVIGVGAVASEGGAPASAADPVVGIAPAGGGYYLVQRDGTVTARGGARYFGDLPALGVRAGDVVAIAPTADGGGYWLVGADGGEFAFGDAAFHGSLPQIGVHVDDIVGMVAAPGGKGYLLVAADGGVFAFGARFHGSLPQIGVRTDDVVGILPTGGEAGYVLVGADGGAFVFGSGAGYHGSLPGEGVAVGDIVGLALTPDGGGYWMAGAGGDVYAFGDAERIASPPEVDANLPIAGIAAA